MQGLGMMAPTLPTHNRTLTYIFWFIQVSGCGQEEPKGQPSGYFWCEGTIDSFVMEMIKQIL